MSMIKEVVQKYVMETRIHILDLIDFGSCDTYVLKSLHSFF